MSFMQKRGLSTLIPPKVASPTVSTHGSAPTSILGIGAAQDAVRMQRVVSFYEKLPRGPAPDPKPRGLLGRYQARYMGKNPSAMRMIPHDRAIVHVIGGLMLIGYIQNYYFHL
ncbi:ATP synthase f chain, mitochondrial precursor, partial [Cryomyces antarcticus]